MLRVHRRVLMKALALALAVVGPVAPAVKRPITEKDILNFHWVADPQISPDGREIAYVRITVNEKEDRYETSLWLVETSGGIPRPLTAGPYDSAPRWSPDSHTLAFLRGADNKPSQLYLLPMGGGEAEKLTDLPKGASAAVWSPDGSTVAFTSRTLAEDMKEHPDPKKSDVRVITRAVYRENGEGWLDAGRHSHVWTVAVGRPRPGKPRQVTSGAYDEEELAWSRDGSRLFFISDRVDEPYYFPPDANVYAVPPAGGPLETVVDIDGPIFQAAPSPDGRSMGFVGFMNPPHIHSYSSAEVFVAQGGAAKQLTARHDFEVGDDIIGDQHPPKAGSGGGLLWTGDGKGLVTVVTEHGRSNLARIDVSSQRVEFLTSGDHDVEAYSATPDTSKFALVIADSTHLGELYLLEGRKLLRLTHENDELLGGLSLSEPEEISYPSFDGLKINAWIFKPPDFRPDGKYPFILDIHGGPHTAYGHNFFHEFQWMAAQGYVVLAPNPRGSTSYGEDFANIIQYRYPGDDYKDLMAGVDEVLHRGFVDEKRLGVTGGSGGGLLTNWVVTQTGRFAAAVSQRSIGDWSAFWYTTDFSLFTPFWFKSTPFHDPEEFLSRSPVRFAENIVTPLMLVEGEEDLRTPSGSGGETMFRALKAQKKPTVMVTFPGENHELSRSGKPSHRIERLRHILNWFDKYLKGRDVPGY
jgi:dipeptidyl aminopeptidase/acylaminoacyl peptidase